MLFNSFEFVLVFLPIVVAGHFTAVRRFGRQAGKWWLIAASLAFYCWAGLRFLPVLLLSAGFNYGISLWLTRPDRRAAGRVLRIGLAGNVLLLCYFKYAPFLPWHPGAAGLPLGVSFFTIQQIMFLMDSYEGLTERQGPLDYALFVCFFPYLIMGPLVHWNDVMPQFAGSEGAVPDRIARGFWLLAMGLFKKAVLADAFSKWSDAGFAYSGTLPFADAWITALAYAMQLYFDFCGYTDMAVGAALMLNVRLPHNFDNPYQARSIIDFWKRWHITLTNFITTYLYTPLVRSARRVTLRKAIVATIVSMAIAGAWHGAGWTFVIWGLLHGIALSINHVWRKRKWRVPPALCWVLTFGFVVADLVWFRSTSAGQAVQILSGMFVPQTLFSYAAFESLGYVEQAFAVVWVALGVALLIAKTTALDFEARFRPGFWVTALTAACLLLSMLYMNSMAVKPFIYRDF